MKKIYLIFFTLHLCACSSTSINQAKSHSIALEMLNHSSKEAYSTASLRACTILSQLSNNESYTLNLVAFVRSLSACSTRYSDEKLSKVWQELLHNNAKIPKWLEKTFYLESLKLAKERNLPSFIAIFLVKLSDYRKLQHDKVEMIQKAIQIAETTQLPFFSKSYFFKKLIKVAPRFNTKINSSNRFKIARDFENNLQFLKARRLYKKIINSNKAKHSFQEKIKAWKRLAISYKNERKREKHIKKIEQRSWWIKRKMKSVSSRASSYKVFRSHWIESQIELARAVWTQNKPQRAKKILQKLFSYQIESQESLALIYKVLGGIDLEAGNINKANMHYKKASKARFSSKIKAEIELKDSVNWLTGWTLYLQKKYREAALHFSKHRKVTTNHYLETKLFYWEAKCWQKLRKRHRADAIFENISKNNSFEYYGILAHKEINKAFYPLRPKTINKTTHLPTFDLLLASNEKELAKSYLDHYRSKLRYDSKIISILPLYQKINYFSEGINTFYLLTPESRKKLFKKNIFLLFPQGYKKIVSTVAREQKLEEEIIFSIIRQESAFNPAVKSPAEAYGLMQITPETASRVARKNKLHQYGRVEDLYNEELNILMGSFLLNELRSRFDNYFTTFVASYNANANAVENWVRQRFEGNHEEFIEMIPYSETQNYVKLILRNYIIYRRLNSNRKFFFPKYLF